MNRLLVIAVLTLLALAPLSAAHAADFILVDKAHNVAPAPIIVSKDASAATHNAATELAAFIAKITAGPKPAILDGEPSPLPDRAVWVGVQPAIQKLLPNVDLTFKEPEETLIAAGPSHLLIAGRDRVAEGKELEQGTLNAIYSFMEKDLGIRWLWPGELGTDIPKSDRIAFAPFERRFHPTFRYRLFWPRNPADWHRPQHMLGDSLQFHAGHAFTKWWDEYHESHPDYFALLPDGSRKPRREPAMVKLCISNPAVADQWLKNAEQRLRADPSLTMVSAVPNDGDGFCVCPKCRAMDNPNGPALFGYVALTDRYVKFWNTLARQLQQRFPGREVWVGTYAYSAYKTPPVAEKLEPNIAVGYVGHFPMVSRADAQKDKEQWLAWSRLAKAMVYRPNLFHYSGGPLGLPTLSMHRTMEDFRFLAEHNCIGIEVDTLPMDWATQGVQYYIMAQLAYDPFQDGEKVLRDYCQRGFGPAADDVARYFDVLEAGHNEVLERVKMSSGWAREATEVFQQIYTDEFWSRAEAHLNSADKALSSSPDIYRKRLDFLRTGYEGAKLQVAVLRAMKKVRETGGKDAAALRTADELCAARDAVFNRYPGLAIKRSAWYIDSRRLADYIDPPNEAMRQGKYTGPTKAPNMKAKD